MMASGKQPIHAIKCLQCDEAIKFEKYVVESSKYDGEIVCKNCGTLLHIKKVDNEIQGYKAVDTKYRHFDKALSLHKELIETMQKDSKSA